MDMLDKIKKSRETIEHEYAMFKVNTVAKTIIQIVVTIVDILIMMVLVWNMFAFCLPEGSWFNIVDGSSMEPTMHSYQVLYTDMTAYGRGDIITAYMPEKAIEINSKYDGQIIVKRIIGVPGDKVVINESGIYINDQKLDEYYLSESAIEATYVDGGSYNSIQLNEGQYFLIGDNRGASFDSRYFGVVTSDDIMYKQSLTPTKNFYLKLAFIILVFALDICIYVLIERILTDFAYKILFKNKKTTVDDKRDENGNCTTSETVILNSERRYK